MNQRLLSQTHSRMSTGISAIYECDIEGKPSNPLPLTPYQYPLYNGVLFDSIGTVEISNENYVIIFVTKFDEDYPEEITRFNIKLDDEEKEIFKSDKNSILSEIDIPKDSSTYKITLKSQMENQKAMKAELNQKISSNQLKYKRFFLIRKTDFDTKSIKSVGCNCGDLVGGALTIPIKLRFESNRIYDFSKDITIGAVGGWRFNCIHCDKLHIIPYLGLGLTSISLDSTNTFGAVSTTSDRSGITAVTGIMFETNKGLQIGFSGGWDFIAKKENIDWVNNGNFWFGFGVGYSLFSESSPPGNGTNKKQIDGKRE